MPTSIVGLYNGQSTVLGTSQQIGAASSNDGGVTVTKAVGNPLITLGSSGDFDEVYAAYPSIVIVAGTAYAFYAGFNGGAWQIGLATATAANAATGPYTKQGVVLSTGSSWDAANVYLPVAYYDTDDSIFKVWYLGSDGGGGFGIGYAHAVDPLSGLTRFSVGSPVLSPSGSGWEGSVIAPDAIAKVGNTFYLAYEGYGLGVQVGLATFTDPEGTYTKYASNPIISPQVSSNIDLASDASIGSNTVSVSSTTNFSNGQCCFIYDTISYEPVRILSKTPTTLTFESNLINNYSVTNSARVVGAAASKTSLRGLFKDGAVWRGALSVFGAVPAPRQVESCIWVEAPALEGPWTYDTTRTWALTPGTPLAWDETSSENFSIFVLSSPQIRASSFVEMIVSA